ncbi:MAG: 3-oxoacyl-ACP synthase III family protein [Culicoidibacterales bacterium]
MKMRNSSIIGFGKATGEIIVTNAMLASYLETNDEWIKQRTGIKSRRITNYSTAKLASYALKNAIISAGIEIAKIDALVVATTTSEHIMPTTAGILMQKLGMERAIPVYEINSACTGFIAALELATTLMEANDYNYIAITGVEKYSQYIDWYDRSTCILFGDGAGSVILAKATRGLISPAFLVNKQDELQSLSLEATINSNCPFVPAHGGQKGEQYITMKGQDVFKFAVKAIPEAISAVLAQQEMSIELIDYVVCHQANERIVHFVAKKYNIPVEKCYMNLSEYGNTGAASIPIVLAEMNEKKLLTSGTKLLLVGFGGGLSWGAIFVEIA